MLQRAERSLAGKRSSESEPDRGGFPAMSSTWSVSPRMHPTAPSESPRRVGERSGFVLAVSSSCRCPKTSLQAALESGIVGGRRLGLGKDTGGFVIASAEAPLNGCDGVIKVRADQVGIGLPVCDCGGRTGGLRDAGGQDPCRQKDRETEGQPSATPSWNAHSILFSPLARPIAVSYQRSRSGMIDIKSLLLSCAHKCCSVSDVAKSAADPILPLTAEGAGADRHDG
jgi:hypothetical protein